MAKFYALFSLFILSSCTIAPHYNTMIINMNYHDARKVIIHNGWQPALNMPSYDEISAPARHLRNMKYNEVEDCAGAGTTSPCLFYFQNDAGDYLKIGTIGEDNGLNMYPRVVYAALVNDIE